MQHKDNADRLLKVANTYCLYRVAFFFFSENMFREKYPYELANQCFLLKVVKVDNIWGLKQIPINCSYVLFHRQCPSNFIKIYKKYKVRKTFNVRR